LLLESFVDAIGLCEARNSLLGVCVLRAFTPGG
jgi:hypothetical protein